MEWVLACAVFVGTAAWGVESTPRAFGPQSLAAIESAHRGQAFWLVLWDLQCGYCMQSMQNMARAQRNGKTLRVVTVATDGLEQVPEIQMRLKQIGLASTAYVFGDEAPEAALRHAIDPRWRGEKPRLYRYEADGRRSSMTGVWTGEASNGLH